MKIIKGLGLLILLASGPLYAWVGHLAGFTAAIVGSATYYQTVLMETSSTLGRILEDRHEAHLRLLDKGDQKWLADKLVFIAERDNLPKDLKDEAKNLRDSVYDDRKLS